MGLLNGYLIGVAVCSWMASDLMKAISTKKGWVFIISIIVFWPIAVPLLVSTIVLYNVWYLWFRK